MTLVEAALRLATGEEPSVDSGTGSGGVYVFCGGDSDERRHNPDCPWLALPQIVKALEMAELDVRTRQRVYHEKIEWSRTLSSTEKMLAEALGVA